MLLRTKEKDSSYKTQITDMPNIPKESNYTIVMKFKLKSKKPI